MQLQDGLDEAQRAIVECFDNQLDSILALETEKDEVYHEPGKEKDPIELV